MARLFEAESLSFRRTGMARLRDAVRPLRKPTSREARLDEDAQTLAGLIEIADILCPQFRLRYLKIVAERAGVNGHYGICYEDGEIRIRLRHAKTGRLLKRSSLIDTLCHELAHLRHLDHSIRFRRLYGRILDRARELGYYQPGPDGRRPRQLALFDTAACGTKHHAHSI